MTDVLLGVDLGTASSKAVLVTLDGQIIASASVAHEWSDVVTLCHKLIPQARGRTLLGVCVSGVGPCLLMCDEDNRPLRPAILYGIDMRATAEIRELTERYGADEIIRRGGTALSTQAVGPKMLWVRRHEPDVWERSSRWHNSNSFIVSRLTGEYVLDHHTASQCDPMYDINALAWHQEWVDDIAPGLQMPRLAWPSDVIGTVTADAASQTGLPLGTPVSAGTVDAWAEAFSAGVRRPGDLMLMYGSTMFFVNVLPALRTSPLLWTTAGVEAGSYTFAAGMATSGSLTAWLQELTGGASFEILVNEAAATPPGADGLLLLPYFAGERTPVFDPRARGVIAGLSLRHSRGHLYRAVYEGIAFGVRQILELLDHAGGGPATRIVAVGGGTKGGLWTQIVSDVTGLQQLIPQQTIGACYGDALLAGIGTGHVPPETDWSRITTTVTPDPSSREVYDALYQAYQDLYPATADQVHLLADLQEAQSNGPAR
jgi:xylulokinase